MIFGFLDGTKLAGFVETLNIYDNLPRLVVLVGVPWRFRRMLFFVFDDYFLKKKKIQLIS